MSSEASSPASNRLFGLFGHPVSHSLSPAFQNAALAAAGIDGRYVAFDVVPEELAAALAGARAMGFAGLNLTVPHKEAGLALASSADPLARLVGAANTLVPELGGWRAYNTDVDGFVQAVTTELGFEPARRRCLLLGAGGAARAAAVGLVRAGAQEILLANRNGRRAAALAAELSERLSATARAVAVSEAPEAGLEAGDLLVSATPLGLQPGASWPWPLARFCPGLLIYDMAYRRTETALVAEAARAGFKAVSGLGMLLRQGALAFTLWTGSPAPVETMAAALSGALRASGRGRSE